MKKRILSLSVFLFIVASSCRNNESNKSHNVVVKYIKDNLGEPNSYSPIEWDSIKPTFIQKSATKPYLEIQDSIELLNDYLMKGLHVKYNPELIDSVTREANRLKQERRKYEYGVDSNIIIGYSLRHRYRAKNNHGAIEVMDHDFRLNLKKDTVITYN